MSKHRRFEKLGLFYILALSTIAISIVVSQTVVQGYISKQQDDSRTINVAGRQRMLSQKISKAALQIENSSEPGAALQELRSAVELWTRSHQALLYGDSSMGLQGKPSEAVIKMFQQIQPDYDEIVASSNEIIALFPKDTAFVSIHPHVNNILAHESAFLQGMDGIVFQYDKEARAKVSRLRNLEILLLVVSLSIIVLELLFIFRPIARNVRKTVDDLILSEKNSIEMASELSRLYEELLKSYQDLEATQYIPETPLVYATMGSDGRFKSTTPKFRSVMQWPVGYVPPNFIDLLHDNGYRKEFTDGLLNILNENKPWSGEVKLTNVDGDFIWLELFIIPSISPVQKDYKIIARDITDFKEAKMKSREINKQKVESKVKEQQYRSVLILEGQEEERQRLGREIHDGLGQMLTALKLSLESINADSSVHTKKRLKDSRDLMKGILQEVRRIAFNLTPTSLSDFGIVPAIRKFCKEIDALSKPNVTFENKSRFVNRLDNHVENNIYRIVQEGVNNSIKYAKANNISVTLEHDIRNLKITISDDGKGFDYEKLKNSDYFQHKGHGIFNMKERAAFINGSFELSTDLNKGTSITLLVPID